MCGFEFFLVSAYTGFSKSTGEHIQALLFGIFRQIHREYESFPAVSF